MRSRWLVIGLFLVGLSAQAQVDAAKRAKVEEILALTHIQDRMAQAKTTATLEMREVGKKQLEVLGLSKVQNDAMQSYYEKIDALVAEKYNWQKIGPQYEQAYMDVYTEDEIDGILAFYKSPVGQALLAKTPQLTKRVLDISREQVASIEPQLQQLTKELVANMQTSQPHH